jgi:hypothetical protein
VDKAKINRALKARNDSLRRMNLGFEMYYAALSALEKDLHTWTQAVGLGYYIERFQRFSTLSAFSALDPDRSPSMKSPFNGFSFRLGFRSPRSRVSVRTSLSNRISD